MIKKVVICFVILIIAIAAYNVSKESSDDKMKIFCSFRTDSTIYGNRASSTIPACSKAVRALNVFNQDITREYKYDDNTGIYWPKDYDPSRLKVKFVVACQDIKQETEVESYNEEVCLVTTLDEAIKNGYKQDSELKALYRK